MIKLLLAAATAALLNIAPVNAAVVTQFKQVGSDVVATLSGTLDLTGLTADTSLWFGGVPFISPANAAVASNTAGALLDLYYGSISGPASFGSGGVTLADSRTGDSVSFRPFDFGIFVPHLYVSGGSLNATMTFLGKTFADFGVTPGDYVYNLPSDTYTVRFQDVAPVPLPAGLPLLFGALGLLAVTRRRKS